MLSKEKLEAIGFRNRAASLSECVGFGGWFRYKEQCPNSGGWMRFAAAADTLWRSDKVRRIRHAAGG